MSDTINDIKNDIDLKVYNNTVRAITEPILNALLKRMADFSNDLVTDLVNGASLDTLKKLSDAINNDPNFHTTIDGLINNLLPLDGSKSMTGDLDLADNEIKIDDYPGRKIYMTNNNDGLVGLNYVDSTDIVLFWENLSGLITTLTINNTAATILSSNVANYKGMIYGADYSTDYIDRSLVDKGFVDAAISLAITNLINSSPAALDTLDELAAALGDDPNFATTITNLIATKLSLSGGTMTGDIEMGANKVKSSSFLKLQTGNNYIDFIGVSESLRHNLALLDGLGPSSPVVVTWQNKSGTVALLSDIPSPKNITVGTITTDSSHTGDTNETVVGSIFIAANTFAAGDFMRIEALFSKQTLGASYKTRLYFNTVNNLTGSPVKVVQLNSASRNHNYNRSAQVKSSSLLMSMYNDTYTSGDYPTETSNATSVGRSYSIDFTSDLYLLAVVELGDVSDIGVLEGLIIERKRA